MPACWSIAGGSPTRLPASSRSVHWDDWQHTHALALTAARQAGDRDAEGRILAGLGDLHGYRQHVDEAIGCLQQSLAAFREAGNRRGELDSLLELGGHDLRQGRFGEAAARFEQGLAGFRELGWRSREAFVLSPGRAALRTGPAGCRLCLPGAEPGADAGDRRPLLGGADPAQPRRRPWRAGPVQGGHHLPRAEPGADTGQRRPHGEAYVLQGFGEVHRRQGLPRGRGRPAWRRALCWRARPAAAPSRRTPSHTLGEVRRQEGRLEEAAACLECSLAVFRDLGFRHWEARALNSQGRLLAAKGRPDRGAPSVAQRLGDLPRAGHARGHRGGGPTEPSTPVT